MGKLEAFSTLTQSVEIGPLDGVLPLPEDDFKKKMAELYPKLVRKARYVTQNDENVLLDLVQDTCERALQHRIRYSSNIDMESWLFIIMRNTFCDQQRIARGRKRLGRTDTNVDDLSDIIGKSGGQIEILFFHQVMGFIRTLAPSHQEALTWAMERRSHQEIMAKTGLNLQAVKSRLNRAREALKKKLEIITET